MGDKRKWIVLCVFCIFTMNNGFAWLMFDPVVPQLKQTFQGMTDEQLELLSSWQPIMYMLAFFPMTRLITTHDGLRKSVRVGTVMELVGATLKLIASLFPQTSAALPLLHMGQMCSAVASPVAIGAVSGLSAQWFEPSERTRATAAAVLFNNVGNAVCYMTVPEMTESAGYKAVTVYELCLAVLAFVLALFVFPATRVRAALEPLSPLIATPGDDNERDEKGADGSPITLVQQLRELFSYKAAILLFLVYSWSSGGYVAWTSLFDEMLSSYYDSVFIGRISFVGTVSYVVGGLVLSSLTDLYFSKRMKKVILICCACNTVACVLFFLSVPMRSGTIVLDFGQGWILFVAGLCGLFNGGAAPVFYELVAEISYPVDEGISGNVMSMCENLGALVIYQAIARIFKASDMNYAFTGGMAITVVLMSLVADKYRRSEAGSSETSESLVTALVYTE